MYSPQFLKPFLIVDCSDSGDVVRQWTSPEIVFAFGAVVAVDLADSTEGKARSAGQEA
jgi:hypothetical protein